MTKVIAHALLVMLTVTVSSCDGASGRGMDTERAIQQAMGRIEADPDSARYELDSLRASYGDMSTTERDQAVYRIGQLMPKGAESEFVREWCYFADRRWDKGTMQLYNIRIREDHLRMTLMEWLETRTSDNSSFEKAWIQVQDRVDWEGSFQAGDIMGRVRSD